MLITCGQIANPDYVPKTWHIYLTLVALLVMQGIICMQSTKLIGWVNRVGTVWNIIIVFIFVIWFPAGAINTPKTNATHETWTSFENGTAWPIGWSTIMGTTNHPYEESSGRLTATRLLDHDLDNVRLRWCVVMLLLSAASGRLTFVYLAPFHLCEESSNANIAAPRAIVMTSVSGLVGGWAIVLVIAYTVKDVMGVVAGPYGQPFGSLCLQVLGQRAGLAMFALNIIAQFFVGQGITITATRVVFAFARDGALPGSRLWSHVDRRTRTPVIATWGVLLMSALLGLLMFASPVAIGAVFSLGKYSA